MKQHKNNLNKELKSMSIKQLQIKAEELNKERVRLEGMMYQKNGSSTLTRNYPAERQTKPWKNLRLLKRDIARVKTFLNMKLLKGEK